MSHPTTHPPTTRDTDDHGAGHGHDEVETAEQVADRERSAHVQRAIAVAVSRPVGPILAVGGAGLTLAFASGLGSSAPATQWLWLLPSLLAMTWGLALMRSVKVAS
jgi:hypothetical protein